MIHGLFSVGSIWVPIECPHTQSLLSWASLCRHPFEFLFLHQVSSVTKEHWLVNGCFWIRFSAFSLKLRSLPVSMMSGPGALRSDRPLIVYNELNKQIAMPENWLEKAKSELTFSFPLNMFASDNNSEKCTGLKFTILHTDFGSHSFHWFKLQSKWPFHSAVLLPNFCGCP